MRLISTALAGALAALTLLSACKKDSAPPPPPNRVWSEYVSAHTAGLISRRAPITVQFAQDLGSTGQDAAAVLSIDPAIAGSLTFTSPRQITLTPTAPLPRGQAYRATLDPKALAGVPHTLEPYEFHFSVIAAQFEVSAATLEAQAGNDTRMTLRGTLETADGEDDATVQQLLKAEYQGKPVSLTWAHVNEGRSHLFSADGIERGESDANLTLQWDGKPLDVDQSGERKLSVPARGVFKVLDTVVESSGRQSITVRFSDVLDTRQNLAGLVTLGTQKLTTSVEGNALRVYPEQVATGEQTLKISAGLQNARGKKLGEDYQTNVSFSSEKPQVRFVGQGVILPDNERLTIPLEGMNLHSVQVTAFQVYEDNIGQFLQVNNLAENNDIQRVGRHLWRKTIKLPHPQMNQWTRYALDASELLRKNPGALFRLTLSINRSNSLYACTAGENAVPAKTEDPPADYEEAYYAESSGWDGIADYYDDGNQPQWQDRDDPCKDGYYRWSEGIRAERNFLASNIGLIAKRGAGGALRVVATNLRDATPLTGADLEVRNFQNQRIASGRTDGEGMASIELPSTPFTLIARNGSQRGYLKLGRGVALATSHFDTGGETVSGGIKGFLFGERGVWRPGDDIHLTFVLEDKSGRLPAGHPVTLQLTDPRGQRVKTVTNTEPVDDFYRFTLKTDEDAPTGTWIAKALVGGAEFSKNLKIETVMPNRLKMELRLPEVLKKSAMPQDTTLWAQWLHGASADGLKADVSAKLVAAPVRFKRNTDYLFDDPAWTYKGEPQTVFEGTLDAEGLAKFKLELAPAQAPAGMLEAQFTTRVFEPGGAFSTGHSDAAYHYYDRYIGLRLPKGDATRDMLLTDIQHPVEVAVLDTEGKPVTDATEAKLSVYKIEWRWWWEQGPDNLGAQFAQNETPVALAEQTIALKDGKGKGTFEIKYPDWGRYLVRVCEPEGGHCSGKVLYIDWPGWAGRAQDQSGPAASALAFSSDKPNYQVGETAVLQLPETSQGRALLSIESGSRILTQRWVQLEKGKTKIDVPLTADMAPNVYASVTLLQPHAGKDNDRPIRLYGIIPLLVSDPAKRLAPVITADKLWRPETTVNVKVSEAQGRAMTYTLAVVDEGLLGLTNFKTPDPHGHFYKREALGVSTWDLFDQVAGAHGGELERLLALGGDEGKPGKERNEQKRFPPVVRVLGPFHLAAGATDTREIALPQYIGEVRVMLVAGYEGAYGSAQQSVTVRTPLSLLATLPRVLGPGERVTLPVSVFAFEPDIREVKLALEVDSKLFEINESPAALRFEKPGEQLARFTLTAKSRTGTGAITVRAEAGAHQSAAKINLAVRAQNPPLATIIRQEVEPAAQWRSDIKPFGIANTTQATLEVSRVPPINLEQRLGYLIQYPHGCLEQTTSAAFPQLYLNELAQLDETTQKRIEGNIKAGIERLNSFQSGGQGFVYWPGGGEVNSWANNYAGHFLVEAKKLGYQVPPVMYDGWLDFQKAAATRWAPQGFDAVENQAYRLYTLALADQPDVGAMNRLREDKHLSSLARWNLAAAYAQMGLPDAAKAIMTQRETPNAYPAPGDTFGSRTRDDGVLLSTLVLLGDQVQAQRVAERLSTDLSTDAWYSTQSTAYALMGMARFGGRLGNNETFSFQFAEGAGKAQSVTAKKALASQPLANSANGGAFSFKNTSAQRLFVSLILRGSPLPGEEKAASDGLSLDVDYSGVDGAAVDIRKLAQGSDLVASIAITNRSGVALTDLALTQVVAAGWEISNPRFASGAEEKPVELDYQDIRDDRVLSYFKLAPGETKRLKLLLNASYRGRYYLPAVTVESMYDAKKQARTAGQWVEVVP